MPLYLVTLHGGTQTVVSCTNVQQARKEAQQECGSRNVQFVTKATKEDVAWHRAMGGYVPEEK
jgi:hypothetical protein